MSNDLKSYEVVMVRSLASLNNKMPDGYRVGGKSFKILVVEDKDFHRKQIVQILESEEYEIVGIAENGRDALNQLDKLYEKDKQVDLMTLNLDMPVLDGYATVCELQNRSQKPLVVFVSEDTTAGVMKDLVSMGIADYILKPINRKVLLERIKAVLVKYNV